MTRQDFNFKIGDLMDKGHRLQAVKFVYSSTGMYLKESKELLDNHYNHLYCDIWKSLPEEAKEHLKLYKE